MVLKAGEARATDESKKFALYSLHGTLLDERHDVEGAVTKYELAKKACGACDQPGQRIVFFDLGATYASLPKPRKSESLANLQTFMKTICKGAAASRYADQCAQAQMFAMKMGGALQ